MKIIIAGLALALFMTAVPKGFTEDNPAGEVKLPMVIGADRAASNDHYLKGLKYYDAGVYEQADAEWKIALQLDPDNADAKNGLQRVTNLFADNNSAAVTKSFGSAAAASAETPYIGLVPGYRGATIPVHGDQLLYLKKGDRIDLLATFDTITNKDIKEKVTATMLQNVIVINVQRPEKSSDMGAVELLCNPNEAQYLALSEVRGDIHIAIRAPGDVEMRPMEVASFRRLIK